MFLSEPKHVFDARIEFDEVFVLGSMIESFVIPKDKVAILDQFHNSRLAGYMGVDKTYHRLVKA